MDLGELLERARIPWPSSSPRLRVHWFSQWSGLLDEALAQLPESSTTPHELLKLLMSSRGHVPKRTALVWDGAEPVAVVGLRRRKQFWEPVWGGGVNERFSLPIREGRTWDVLAALDVNVWLVTRQPPKSNGSVRSVTSLPLHQINCSVDLPSFWRTSGNRKAIQAARVRTKHMHLAVDQPGSAKWIIGEWGLKWGERWSASDVLLVADYYQRAAKYHSFVLFDGETPAAGLTVIADGKAVLAHVTYRSPAYDHHGAGNRVYELAFEWLAAHGYELIDLGYSYRSESYKKRWAPKVGEVWLVNLAPTRIHLPRELARATRTFLRSAQRVRAAPGSTGASG